MSKRVAVCCACAILGGCADAPQSGRVQLTAPTEMSAVYSEMNLQLKLVTTADAKNRCAEPGCGTAEAFDQRVARIGPDLAKAAYHLYPDLGSRFNNFEFFLIDKSEPGTMSTSTGRIAILRPVNTLAPADPALAFIVAREIGHVVAKHHEEDTANSLIVAGLVQIFAPVLNIARVFANYFLAGATTTSASASIAANASVTATSFVGTRLLITSYKPKQRDEADAIAMKLLALLGYDAPAVAGAFATVDLRSPATDWASDLKISVERLSPQPPGNRSILVDSTAVAP